MKSADSLEKHLFLKVEKVLFMLIFSLFSVLDHTLETVKNYFQEFKNHV